MAVDDKKQDGSGADTFSDEDMLREFKELPRLYEGRDVTIEFTQDNDFTETSPALCGALYLPVGATVDAFCRVTAFKYGAMVFAKDNMAREIRSYPKGTDLKAKAKTKFGTYTEVEQSNSGGVEITHTIDGLLLTQVIAAKAPTGDAKQRSVDMTVDDKKHDGSGADPCSDEDIILAFKDLPKLYKERDVTIDFTTDESFTSESPDICEALYLKVGTIVSARCRLTAPENYYMRVLAEGDLAREVRRYKRGTILKVKAKTQFGTYEEVEHHDRGAVEKTCTVEALLLTQVVKAEPATDGK